MERSDAIYTHARTRSRLNWTKRKNCLDYKPTDDVSNNDDGDSNSDGKNDDGGGDDGDDDNRSLQIEYCFAQNTPIQKKEQPLTTIISF